MALDALLQALLGAAGNVLDTPGSVVRGLGSGALRGVHGLLTGEDEDFAAAGRDLGRAFTGIFDPSQRVSGEEFTGDPYTGMAAEMILDPVNLLGGLGLLKGARAAAKTAGWGRGMLPKVTGKIDELLPAVDDTAAYASRAGHSAPLGPFSGADAPTFTAGGVRPSWAQRSAARDAVMLKDIAEQQGPQALREALAGGHYSGLSPEQFAEFMPRGGVLSMENAPLLGMLAGYNGLRASRPM